MLVALFRASALLRLPRAKASLPHPELPPARLAKTYGYLATRTHSTTMLKQAVKNHGGASPSSNATSQQQFLINSFKHQQGQPTQSTRPLSTGSGNIIKHNATVERRPSGQSHGIKRTSSGLAKALGSQEDAFEYPALSISDSGNEFMGGLNTMTVNMNTGQAPVLFDADDFDSDIDLDVEDLAAKETVRYPSLPVSKPSNRDSAYGSVKPPATTPNQILDSSQPIPWSSSPIAHFQPPQKPIAQPAKRRTLPWAQQQKQARAFMKPESAGSPEPEPEQDARSKKRRSQETSSGDFTPLPKDTSKSTYPWNTTASAVKQQQKSLREQNKKLTKANDSTEDEVKKAISKKKKNTVHRIFLSEEQQQVLNLVVEYKKSVFFTGSAGKHITASCNINPNLRQVPESLFFYGKLFPLYARSTSENQIA